MPEPDSDYRARADWFEYHLNRESDSPDHPAMMRMEALGLSFRAARRGMRFQGTSQAFHSLAGPGDVFVTGMDEEDLDLIEFLVDSGIEPDETPTWAAFSYSLSDRFGILWYAQQGVSVASIFKVVQERPGGFLTAFNMVHSDIDSSLIDSLTSGTR